MIINKMIENMMIYERRKQSPIMPMQGSLESNNYYFSKQIFIYGLQKTDLDFILGKLLVYRYNKIQYTICVGML